MSLKPKSSAEEFPLSYDFTNLIGAENIGSQVWSVSLLEGTDPNPSAILSGSPSSSSKTCIHKIVGGVAGAKYRVACLATTTPSGEKWEIAAELSVVANRVDA